MHNGTCLETAALKETLGKHPKTSKEKTEREEAEKERQEDAHNESFAKEQDVHNASFAKEQDAHDASSAKRQDEQFATPATAISVLGYLDQNRQRQKSDTTEELDESLAGLITGLIKRRVLKRLD